MLRFFTVLLSAIITTQSISAEEQIRERIEWIDIWVTDADKHDLPRVLLIGDSITRGYFNDVEKKLAGKAYCARLATSKCVSAPSFSDEVKLLLKQYKFDAIHFNNGLHGWGYSEAQYQDGLLKFLETVNKHAGGAKLIWATTTPMRESSNLQTFTERNERVKARNQIAAKIMKAHNIPINDLYGLVEQHPEWHSKDGVHFNGEGKTSQGAAVSESLLKVFQSE